MCSNLSSGLIGIPRSPLLNLRLASSILSCTEKNGLWAIAQMLDDSYGTHIDNNNNNNNNVNYDEVIIKVKWYGLVKVIWYLHR